MSPVIDVKKLTKLYPGKRPFLAVDDISFKLEEGEILGLLGPNGSGKTTTIQMLLGALTYTSGSISYFGKNFESHRSEVLQDVAFASTYMSLPWNLSIAENLKVFGRLYGLSPKEIEKRADPLLERFGILDKKKVWVSALSAGQVTRLMIVKAFFVRPKIALLDEPTASLDPDISREICNFLLEQREKSGISILFSSHKMEEVTALCDRAIFLKKGKIIADDKPQKLALSTSSFKMKLIVTDGMKRTVASAEKMGLKCSVEHRTAEISLQEKEIPLFLNALSKADVDYSSVRIEEPSLEDYFLELARTNR